MTMEEMDAAFNMTSGSVIPPEVADCPLCHNGYVPGTTAPTGDDPERPCPLCGGIGQVPVGYRDEWVRLDDSLWQLRQETIMQKLRISELTEENRTLRRRLMELTGQMQMQRAKEEERIKRAAHNMIDAPKGWFGNR